MVFLIHHLFSLTCRIVKKGFPIRLMVILLPLFIFSGTVQGHPPKKSSLKIISYHRHLNRQFQKVKRKSTRYIIIHTSEAGLVSTLRTLSQGKRVGRRRTRGGHANYAISRNGDIYRIMHHRYRADHTGLSMWNGLSDISSHSLGIELVGFHYGKITSQQYQSLTRLLNVLQRIYNIPDRNVLTHSQVSYGKPNLWYKKNHRGRKRCAINFERHRAGLTDRWTYDPDVRAKRLQPDRHVHRIFYGKPKPILVAAKKETVQASSPAEETVLVQNETLAGISNIIMPENSAWNIAGEDFDSPATTYVFPGGRMVRGDRIKKGVGWDKIPVGTQVMLNQPMEREKKVGPVFVISGEYTAWGFAGIRYRKTTTIYFFPNGKIVTGDRVRDWDNLPNGTRLIVGYRGPYYIEAKRGKTPWGLAGRACRSEKTVYHIPGKGVETGEKIQDFSSLPNGSSLFLPVR